MEIPILMRILERELDFKDLVSRVLAFDYIGALVASLLFPLFLVPKLGLARTSLLFGMLNAAVGIWGTWLLEPLIKKNVNFLRVKGFIIIILLLIAFIKADYLTSFAEDATFYRQYNLREKLVVSTNYRHQRQNRLRAFFERQSAI